MPRTKPTTTSKRKKVKAAPAALGAPPSSLSPSVTAKQLFEAAENLLTSSQDANQVVAMYTAALSCPRMDMDRTIILEKRAEARVSIADQEGARQDYQQALDAVRARPTTPAAVVPANEPNALERQASLLLCMGQLSGGEEALQCYREGIQLLKQSLEIRSTKDPTAQETRQQWAAACCGAAEVYLTDLCYEDNAEQQCEVMVQEAIQAFSPPILDALQTAASLRLSQCRGEEALGYIRDCFDRIRLPCEALSRLVGLRRVIAGNYDSATMGPLELTPAETNAVQTLPGFEFRTQTAKLLLECSAVSKEAQREESTRECAEAAVTVLGSLFAENDEVIELWFLCGDAFAALQESDLAAHYYERTLEMLQSVQQSLEQEEDAAASEEEQEDLQQQLDEVSCQLEDVQQKLQSLQPDASNTLEREPPATLEPMDEGEE